MIINAITTKLLLILSLLTNTIFQNNIVSKEYIERLTLRDRTYKIIRTYSHIPMDINHILYLIDISYEYGIDPDLVLAVIETESSYNPNAKNKSSSARGYGQIIKSTGKYIASKIIIEDYNHEVDAIDPYLNIHMTVYYIKRCINSSKGSLINALRLYRGVDDEPYFNKILNIRKRIKQKKLSNPY